MTDDVIENLEFAVHFIQMSDMVLRQVRREIVKRLKLDGGQLGNNIVYEYGSAGELAKFLYKLVKGDLQNGLQEKGTGNVKGMIERYSDFEKPRQVHLELEINGLC